MLNHLNKYIKVYWLFTAIFFGLVSVWLFIMTHGVAMFQTMEVWDYM